MPHVWTEQTNSKFVLAWIVAYASVWMLFLSLLSPWFVRLLVWIALVCKHNERPRMNGCACRRTRDHAIDVFFFLSDGFSSFLCLHSTRPCRMGSMIASSTRACTSHRWFVSSTCVSSSASTLARPSNVSTRPSGCSSSCGSKPLSGGIPGHPWCCELHNERASRGRALRSSLSRRNGASLRFEDDDLQPRRKVVPGGIRHGSHRTRRCMRRRVGPRWDCACSREENHVQST